MYPVGKLIAGLLVLVAAGGCVGKKTTIYAPPRIVYYELVSEETVRDREGRLVRIYHWRYEDGVTTTTEEFVLPGQDQARRRDKPEPDTRLVD